MDAIASTAANSESLASKDVKLLKKSQDLAKQEMAALLEALPPPPKAAAPGLGGAVDMTA